ncbi:BZ3501_MvSof-1269-A2-R1_Chr12-3g03709 [Microbotryum saponariae]|nr:BZ3501_MvSof-1269-A2-R1_Chr12-3g03709 [Microbotryum saponariae]
MPPTPLLPSDRCPSSLLPPLDESSPIDDAWIFIVDESESGGASSPNSAAPTQAPLIEPSSGPSRTGPKTRSTDPDRDPYADPDNQRESVASDPFERALIINPEEVSIKEVIPPSNLPDIPSLVYHSDETKSFGIETAGEGNGDTGSSPASERFPTGSPVRKPSLRRGISVPLLSVDTDPASPNRPYSAPPTNHHRLLFPFPFTSSLSPISSDSEARSPTDAAPLPLTTNSRPTSRKRGSDGSTLSKGSAYLGGQAWEAQRWIIRTATQGAKGFRSAASTKKVDGGGGDEATELKRRIEERERVREREKEEWRVLADGLQERKVRGSASKHVVLQGRRGVRVERDDRLRRKRRCIWIGVVLGVVAFVLVGAGCLLWHLRQQRLGGDKSFDQGTSNGAGDIVIPPTPPPNTNSTPPILPDIHNSTNATNDSSSRPPHVPPCPPQVPPCPPRNNADVKGIKPGSTYENSSGVLSGPNSADEEEDSGADTGTSKWELVKLESGDYMCVLVTEEVEPDGTG